MAILHVGGICVPLYDTLGATAVTYIMNDANVSTAFVSKDRYTKVGRGNTEAFWTVGLAGC